MKYREVIENALKELIDTKHLYQSVAEVDPIFETAIGRS